MRKFSIKHWAADDQPRKKLLVNGADTLSNAELLAILINNGTPDHSALDVARNLLQAVNNDLQKLAGLSVKEMVKENPVELGRKLCKYVKSFFEGFEKQPALFDM